MARRRRISIPTDVYSDPDRFVECHFRSLDRGPIQIRQGNRNSCTDSSIYFNAQFFLSQPIRHGWIGCLPFDRTRADGRTGFVWKMGIRLWKEPNKSLDSTDGLSREPIRFIRIFRAYRQQASTFFSYLLNRSHVLLSLFRLYSCGVILRYCADLPMCSLR